MPVIIEQNRGETPQEVEALIYDEKGEYTLEGETLEGFLSFVDWSEFFADEKLVEKQKVYIKQDGDKIQVVDKDTEGAEEVELESIDGEKLADLVDFEDLVDMFEWFLNDMYDEEMALEDKARIACFLDEKFKKGAFRKIHKGGGKDQVARMLIAMMKKGAIQRADTPGKGYRGGDYTKNKAGYPSGTPKGRKIYKAYVTGKGKGKAAKAKRKAKKGAKLAARLAASAEPQTSLSTVTEGAKLSGRVLNKIEGRHLTEKKETKND